MTQLMLELRLPAGACQRWRNRRHSFVRRRDGGFDRSRYRVIDIDERTARHFVAAHHYSRTLPATRLRYGLIDRQDDSLVGVAVLSVPVQASVLTAVFPRLEPYRESLELGRLVLLDPVAANAETHFLAGVFRAAAHRGIRGVVSFSDPVQRTTPCGRVVMPGHVGIVYQAKGALYTGRATPRTVLLLPDGTVLNGACSPESAWR